MAARKEIVTLQFGHFSNFIGTHWWNIQELGFDYSGTSPSNIDHDVLFREGETRNGEVTFTPRVLLVDLHGSLGTLPEHGGLYETSLAPDPMDVWSDFLRTRYHPRTIHLINEYTHHSEPSQFDAFPQGSSLWTGEQFEERFIDQIRRYAEECDALQGFHILLDSVNGFGGLGAAAAQYLSEEYTRKPIFAFPSAHGNYLDSEASKEGLRMTNLALCLQSLSTHCSLIVPLSTSRSYWQQKSTPRDFEFLQYDASLPYHTSSILAATLDTATLRYRLRGGTAGGLTELAQELALGGRKAVAASLTLPFPMQDRSYLLDTLEQWDGPLWQSVSSCCDLSQDRVWAQSVVLRGIPNSKLKSNPAYTSNTVEEMLKYYLECTCTDTPSHVTAVASPCHVGAPFPHIFTPTVGYEGYIWPEPRPENTGVSRVPVLAGLHTCRSVGAMLGSLQAQAAHYPWRKLSTLAEAGLERDEHGEALEQLLTFAECYNEEFEV
ncbi:hypothetical protein B566_EDAN014143 [Ephemera danica]|nr:hypothetical protein B566_EDAN014143 [Ephemera danica]